MTTLLEDLDAAERTEREPPRSRAMRRLGGGLALAAVAMCLLGVFGGRWWTLEFGSGLVAVGLGESRFCDTRGEHCEALPEYEFVRYAASRSGGEAADAKRIQDWLDQRGPAQKALAAAMVAATILGVIAIAPRRRDGVRVVAGVAGVAAVAARVLVFRFLGSTPFDLLTRGVHGYIACAGLVDLLLGAVLVAIPRGLPTLPTARVVTR